MSHPDRVTAKLIDHVISHRYEALSPSAVTATSTFVLDSLGVALAGSRVPLVPELIALAQSWGQSNDCRVWGVDSAFRPSRRRSSTAIKSTTKNGTACMSRPSYIPWRWCSRPCSLGPSNRVV